MNQEIPKTEDGIDNSFIRTLTEIGDGDLVNRASEKLKLAVAAVKETGKNSTVVIKLKISQSKATAMLCEGDVEVKIPKTDLPAALFFPTADNLLSRQNPAQKEFALRAIAPDPAAATRTVAEAPAPEVRQVVS